MHPKQSNNRTKASYELAEASLKSTAMFVVLKKVSFIQKAVGDN